MIAELEIVPHNSEPEKQIPILVKEFQSFNLTVQEELLSTLKFLDHDLQTWLENVRSVRSILEPLPLSSHTISGSCLLYFIIYHTISNLYL